MTEDQYWIGGIGKLVEKRFHKQTPERVNDFERLDDRIQSAEPSGSFGTAENVDVGLCY